MARRPFEHVYDYEDHRERHMDPFAVWIARQAINILDNPDYARKNREFIVDKLKLMVRYLLIRDLYLIVWQRAQVWFQEHTWRDDTNLTRVLGGALFPQGEMTTDPIVPNAKIVLNYKPLLREKQDWRIFEASYNPRDPKWDEIKEALDKRYMPRRESSEKVKQLRLEWGGGDKKTVYDPRDWQQYFKRK
jgi:hypothetical protein